MSKRKANLAKKKNFGGTYAALRARIKAGNNIAQIGKRNGAAPRIALAADGGTGPKQPACQQMLTGNTIAMKSTRKEVGMVPSCAWRSTAGPAGVRRGVVSGRAIPADVGEGTRRMPDGAHD
jgi:hypothetical protein